MRNIIIMFEINDIYVDEYDPWKSILAASAFSVRFTYHIIKQK